MHCITTDHNCLQRHANADNTYSYNSWIHIFKYKVRSLEKTSHYLIYHISFYRIYSFIVNRFHVYSAHINLISKINLLLVYCCMYNKTTWFPGLPSACETIVTHSHLHQRRSLQLNQWVDRYIFIFWFYCITCISRC